MVKANRAKSNFDLKFKIDNQKIGNGRVGKFAKHFKDIYLESVQLSD